jgi:sugar-phosphatase
VRPGARGAYLTDLDGVLVDSDASARRGWRAWCKGHQLPYEPFAALHGFSAEEKIRRLAGHLDPAVEAEKITAFEIRDTEGVTAFPGAAALLARPGPLAVVTSARVALAQARLRAAGLVVPSVIVGGDTVEETKPNPEPYLLAAHRLHVEARECVVFEDAPSGIVSAKLAGAFVVGLRTTYQDDDAILGGADLVVDDIAAYLALLDEEARG